LDWDREAVKEDVESWLGRKTALRERVVATDEREVEMAKVRGKGLGEDAESVLEERVVDELVQAGVCLGGGNANAGGSEAGS
jgi:nuclear pore complex protein Nup188